MTAADEQQVDEYLGRLKASGRSAPAGRYWDDLYRLITRGLPKDTHPRLPLILGGSIASDAEKQERLREHLLWALAHARLAHAYAFLEKIPENGWNVGTIDRWSETFSWEDEE